MTTLRDTAQRTAASLRAVAGSLNGYDESIDLDGDELHGLVQTLLKAADRLTAALAADAAPTPPDKPINVVVGGKCEACGDWAKHCGHHQKAAPTPPADERRYPLTWCLDGRPMFTPHPKLYPHHHARPDEPEWYGHDGYTLAWYEYADGSHGHDWRRVVGIILPGDHNVVEYATAIVFRKREVAP